MKKIMALLCLTVLVLSIPFGGCAEGLFPSFASIFSVEMPSFRAAAQREPDKTESLADGGTTVTFLNVTAAEFDAFSVYISQYGCTLSNYTSENGVFSAVLSYKDKTFSFSYDNMTGEAVITYPVGTLEEIVELSAPEAEIAPEPIAVKIEEPVPEVNIGVSLIIPADALFFSKKMDNEMISFNFDIQNTHPTKRVKSYEVAYYTCDEHNVQNSAVKTVTLKQDIAPGETVKSSQIVPSFNSAKDIRLVYVAITGVHYDDGSSEYDPNPTYKFWIL